MKATRGRADARAVTGLLRERLAPDPAGVRVVTCCFREHLAAYAGAARIDESLRAGARLEVRCEGMVHGGLCLAHAERRDPAGRRRHPR